MSSNNCKSIAQTVTAKWRLSWVQWLIWGKWSLSISCFMSQIHLQPCDFSECSWKKRSSHQGKKEVACIVSKPLVSCLWRCGESVNPVKLNIQDVQGTLSSRPKGHPGPLPIFQDWLLLSNYTPASNICNASIWSIKYHLVKWLQLKCLSGYCCLIQVKWSVWYFHTSFLAALSSVRTIALLWCVWFALVLLS